MTSSCATPSWSFVRRAASVLGIAGSMALVLGGCSSGSPSSSGSSGGSSARSEVAAATVGGVGTVLVNGAGLTLYLFEPDRQSAPTCTGSCASAWPPYFLPAGVTAPRAGPGATPSLLGTVRASDGSLQVTYDRWPLYRWVGDSRPGVATGQGLNQFGGLWYVVSPAGAAVKR